MLKTRVLDVARSAYVGLPPGVRRSVGPILGLLPLRYRFGKSYLSWRNTITKARQNPELVPALQNAALERALTLAYQQSPFYRETLSSLVPDGNVSALIGTDLWSRIPVVNGNVVRREAARMCTRPPSQLDVGATGGSSGKPLTFFLDKDRSPIEHAFVMDAWSAAGCTEQDWQATFRGFQIDDLDKATWEVEAGLREVRFSVFHMRPDLMTRYLKEIERRRIHFLKGYPSGLAALASHAVRHGITNPCIRGIMLHSEYVYARYRELLSSAFPNARLVPFYGMSEKCAFAVEDADEPGSYHFDPLYGYTELLDDDDRPVTTPGKRGRIVSTGLLYLGMPFIRYDTGDEAEFEEAPSAGNGYRLSLKGVTPRFTDEFVVARSGDQFHVSVLFMIDQELAPITNLQFEQFEPGVLHMRCVLVEGADPSVTDIFGRMVDERTDGNLKLVASVVDHIPLTPRGKRPVIIQHLKTDKFGYERLINLPEQPLARGASAN